MEFSSEPLETVVAPATEVKERPERIFWFKRHTGDVFCCKEEEAWTILRGRIRVVDESGNMTQKKHEYLGASNSLIYFRGLNEMRAVFKEKGQQAAQEFLRNLEKQELATADRNIRPRNMDSLDLNSNPVDIDRMRSPMN